MHIEIANKIKAGRTVGNRYLVVQVDNTGRRVISEHDDRDAAERSMAFGDDRPYEPDVIEGAIADRDVDFALVYRALRTMGRRPWRAPHGTADAHDATMVILAGFDVRRGSTVP